MNRIKALDWYQRGILLVLAAMIVIFGVVYHLAVSRVGYLYHDKIFVPAEENGSTVYSATLDGKESSFTVTADKTVTFRYGDRVYGPYTAKLDPTAVPKNEELHHSMTGIEVRSGDEVIFRGGVLQYGSSENPHWMLYNEDGTGADIGVTVIVSNGTVVDAEGNPVDQMKPSLHTVLALMSGPKLTHKGHWAFWFLGVVFSLVTAVSVLFADDLFRHRLRYRIRDAELAEPSDWEIASRYISWTLMVIILLVVYIKGLK